MKHLSLILFIGLFHSTFAQSYHERYERVQAQPYHMKDFDLVGKVKEVSTEHFTMNENGEYVRSEYVSGSVVRFNENGTLSEKITLLSDGDTFQKEYYSYNSASLLTSITLIGFTSTANGKKASEIGKVNYSYDKNGNLISLLLDGKTPYERKFTYDEKGRLIVDECTDFKDEYAYDGKSDKILTCTFSDYSEFHDLSAVCTYHYYASNQLKSIELKRNDREHYYRDYIVTYYENGKLEMISTGDTNNIALNSGRTSYYYNEKGYLSATTSYNVYLGEGDAKGESQFSYSYDKNENWTEQMEVNKSSYSLENKAKENWSNAEVSQHKTVRKIVYY